MAQKPLPTTRQAAFWGQLSDREIVAFWFARVLGTRYSPVKVITPNVWYHRCTCSFAAWCPASYCRSQQLHVHTHELIIFCTGTQLVCQTQGAVVEASKAHHMIHGCMDIHGHGVGRRTAQLSYILQTLQKKSWSPSENDIVPLAQDRLVFRTVQ
jgi:hypothetical protein